MSDENRASETDAEFHAEGLATERELWRRFAG